MKSSLMRVRWAAIGAAVAVSMGAGAVMVANATAIVSDEFVSIKPCRLLDTRDDNAGSKIANAGIRRGTIAGESAGGTINNDITVIFDKDAVKDTGEADSYSLNYSSGVFRPIMGDCDARFTGGDLSGGILPDALLLNVTTVGSSANGFVTIYPWQTLLNDSSAPATGTNIKNRPFYSNLNPISSIPSVSNNVTVQLVQSTGTIYIPGVKCATGSHTNAEGTSGSNCSGLDSFRVYNQNGSTHVIIDVLGYYR